MRPVLAIAFREEVTLVEASVERAVLEFPGGSTTVPQPSDGVLRAVRLLFGGQATEDDIADQALDADGPDKATATLYYLNRWNKLGLLSLRVLAEGQPVVTAVSMEGGIILENQSPSDATRFRLSRFAYLRRERSELLLETPLSDARAIIHEGLGAMFIGAVAKPRTVLDLCGDRDSLLDTARAFLWLLRSARLIEETNEHGDLAEDRTPQLTQWAFHDLLFHGRSRLGQHDYPMGATFPYLGRIPPLPALKRTVPNGCIALHKPDLFRMMRADAPFAVVFERRRSVRDFHGPPIDAAQLGEFLYRVGRVRHVVEPDPVELRPYETTNRPYPSGGAAYDLEIYATIGRCEGLERGLYHYDPLHHALARIESTGRYVDALLSDAALSMGVASEPPILIVLASRFQRMSWKYSGIAYATILKNVGVLYQTMYLAATAMGLGGCALGAGNSSLFADAAGTDRISESSVGEFVLGNTEAAD